MSSARQPRNTNRAAVRNREIAPAPQPRAPRLSAGLHPALRRRAPGPAGGQEQKKIKPQVEPHKPPCAGEGQQMPQHKAGRGTGQPAETAGDAVLHAAVAPCGKARPCIQHPHQSKIKKADGHHCQQGCAQRA